MFAVGIDSDGTLDANMDTNTSHRWGCGMWLETDNKKPQGLRRAVVLRCMMSCGARVSIEVLLESRINKGLSHSKKDKWYTKWYTLRYRWALRQHSKGSGGVSRQYCP